MKKFIRFPLMAICIIAAIIVVSCSKDDENDGYVSSSSTSLKINGTQIGDIKSAVCDEAHFQGEYWVSFGTYFYFMKDLVDFAITVPVNSVSQLKRGEELVDYIETCSFYVLLGDGDSNIGFGGGNPRFKDLEGSVKVKEINSSSVTLQFSNFSFIKVSGSDEKEYTFNGTVKYDIN